MTGRREERLRTLQNNIGSQAIIQTMDLSDPDAAMLMLEQETVSVNVTGFMAMAQAAISHFESQGSGHLVGLTSISAIRGNGGAPAYGASKAFVSHYLVALRCRHHKNNSHIIITEIQPGFVDTEMAQGKGLFWVAPVKKAGRQIMRAIEKRRNTPILPGGGVWSPGCSDFCRNRS